MKKEGKMEKKYLKKVLTGLSIAGLVTGISGLTVSASG
jgi:radical SAM modification target selenobiotic family peptide